MQKLYKQRYWSLLLTLPLVALSLTAGSVSADGNEFTGKFESKLVANEDDLDQVIFRPLLDRSMFKTAKPIDKDAVVTAGHLYHASSDKPAILAFLVEPQGESPYLLADIDMNNEMGEGERFELERDEEDDPYVWQTIVAQPLKEGPFQSFPLLVQYLKNVRWGNMKEGERMVLASKRVFARGSVVIEGKPALVQYEYNPRSKKVSVTTGKLGVDSNGDGEIDLDPFSAESAEAQDEAVIFRVSSAYVSTKRADLEKNQITMKSHSASDYKRIELRVGGEMPDFQFTDFNGKKRRLSEFKGKYLLIDFWGMWCPPCREELPYLRSAYSRFQARGFEILGMNTDEPEIASQLKTQMEKNGMPWPQAKRDSIKDVIRNLRIQSFPTTVLLGPDGKIVSLNNTKKGEPELRGKQLLQSLDKLLKP
ncbi:MAG TPA: TlpA disulfide reductase family protein [Blastocatellia bacterium]|nr:TlpA disulfide reductase family protein [Blastocatellia bacterium]